MKNIHLLETDKPSKLFIIDQSGMFIAKPPYLSFSAVGGRVHKVEGSELYKPQHIYITKDEKIKPNDAFINLNRLFTASRITFHGIEVESGDMYDFELSKKIILTNDTKLIASGVQEIDEEFLKWYINNPDCEFVEVEEYNSFGVDNWKYLITIPQEKFKHKGKSLTIEEVMEGRSNAYEFIKFDDIVEQAAENYAVYHFDSSFENIDDHFIAGAKWQQGRGYSEEEVKELLKMYRNSIVEVNPIDIIYLDKWFEKFKK